MTQITLTPEQTAALNQAVGPVVLVDAAGQQVGQVAPRSSSHFTAEELAEMERRIGKDGPYITTDELLAKLQAMDRA